MPIGPARMPLFDHLGELRMRLVRIVACLAVAVVVFYMATPTMGQFLLMPIAEFLPNVDGMASLQAIDPFEAFSVLAPLAALPGPARSQLPGLGNVAPLFNRAVKVVFIAAVGAEVRGYDYVHPAVGASHVSTSVCP